MNQSSRDFVYEKFSEFYSSPSTLIPSPHLLEQREIGFLLFKKRIMLRHKVFLNANDLKSFLSDKVPSDVYRSCAYYEYPDADMDKKVWLGADLVFDIDADHIPTSCNKLHSKNWVCKKCLDSAKKETVKLVDMLEQDFGFIDKETHIFFSGHRGYHVQVENEAAISLDSMARKEIVDYVTGLGLTIAGLRRNRKEKKASDRFFLSDFSWNKRIKKRIATLISNAKLTDLKQIGLREKESEMIIAKKSLVLDKCIGEGLWESVPGVSDGTWKKLANYAKDLESARVDSVVTTDIHRLIRMNGTLHGKTGLKKVEFPVNRIAGFDPLKEAIAFKEGSVKVSINEDVPKFGLGGSLLGPFKQGAKPEVPTAAAVLLICKDRADLVN